MTTAAAAFSAIKAAVVAGVTSIPIYWRNEDFVLPDTPTAFAWATFDVMTQGIAAFGGGRGANEWLNMGRLVVYVFVPVGTGTSDALGYAESFCAVLRGQRFSGVSCVSAYVDTEALLPAPEGNISGNYDGVAAVIDLHFYQTG